MLNLQAQYIYFQVFFPLFSQLSNYTKDTIRKCDNRFHLLIRCSGFAEATSAPTIKLDGKGGRTIRYNFFDKTTQWKVSWSKLVNIYQYKRNIIILKWCYTYMGRWKGVVLKFKIIHSKTYHDFHLKIIQIICLTIVIVKISVIIGWGGTRILKWGSKC